MIEVGLAFIGFGNVAQGFTQILEQKGEEYAKKFGIKFLISAIADPIKGTAFNPEGLSPTELLEAVQKTGSLDSLPGLHPGWDAMEMIQNSPADAVIEMSYTNLQTAEPATTYIAEALRRKKNVVTTNKGPVALHYDSLMQIARVHGVSLGVEGTVMSGTPVLHVGCELLAGAGIQRIQGILNGTSNYILTQMESGKSYAEALAEAQSMGYAEADPTGDVEGYDAAAKVAILSRLVLGANIPFESVERKGISELSQQDIESARSDGKHWKLVGSIEKNGKEVRASVGPQCLLDDHPLARIKGATNAIVYTTEFLGDVTITGPGAGRIQTGYAILQDLFYIYRKLQD